MTGQPHTVRVRAVPLAATLSFAVCVGLFPSFALGALSPFIISELGLSRARYGTLGTAAFVSAALLSPAAGAMVDRLGARRAMVTLFVVAALAWGLVGIADGYAQLAGAICIAGIAKALANPATTSMVLQAVSPPRRARFVGFAQTGPPIAGLTAGFLLPAGSVAVGWRTAVLVFACVGLAGGLSASAFLPPRTQAAAARSPAPSMERGGARSVQWGLAAYAFLVNTAIVPVLLYTPLYAFQQLSWKETAAALLTGAVGVTSLIGRFAWTLGSPGQRSVSLRLTVLPLAAAVAVVLIGVAGAAQMSWLLWLGVGAFGASATTWTALTMLAVMVRSSAAAGQAGRAAGDVMLLGFLGGAVGPLLAGWAIDASGSYTPAWAIAFVALLATALVARLDARGRA